MNIRLFVAIPLPETIKADLARLTGGLPGARWSPPVNQHLTVRFIGEVDGVAYESIRRTLGAIERDPFPLTLSGVGFFPPRKTPRVLWAGVEDEPRLHELHQAVDRALVQAGLEPERRKFSPHITLARLQGTPSNRVARFLEGNALFRAGPFQVSAIDLYSSRLRPSGAIYTREESYSWKTQPALASAPGAPGE